MNNNTSSSLTRIFSTKHPQLNPTKGCHCFTMDASDHYGFIAYGLGWWMSQAELKQDEINDLKAELARLKGEKVS
jgi:hypothetical protein